MRSKLAVALGAAVAAGTAGYWYFSPYLAMKATQDAAQARDAEAFNAWVDYPKLRESFKGQMAVFVTQSMGQSATGAVLGLAFVNQMVEAVMQPDMVMSLMQASEAEVDHNGRRADGSTEPKRNKLDWTFERPSLDKLIAHVHEEGKSHDGDMPSVVFERSGFADWKLTEIRVKFER